MNFEGSPFVYNKVNRVNPDSIHVIKYISSINKRFDSLIIKSVKGEKIETRLTIDTLYSNMLIASFGYNFKDQNELCFLSSINQYDECFKRKQVIRDTMKLYYRK